MVPLKLFTVEVAYALPQVQRVLTLEIPTGTTAKQAIELSGILQIFPEIDLSLQAIGIFSEKISLDTVLNAGDRVEIYRPLLIDPKEARFKRVNEARRQAASLASQPKPKRTQRPKQN
jgi:putative ubiquitin-RnfH superfamily antitoxin RatB of RatAB toxin-antitoxin module